MQGFKPYVSPLTFSTALLRRTEQVGEAYQVLSNEELRKRYDKFGKDQAVPGGGFGKFEIKQSRDFH